MNFRNVMGDNDRMPKIQKDFEFDATAVARAHASGKKCFFNLVIIDESGSMTSIYKQALDGLNETLNTIRTSQKEDETQQHFVTLLAFDSNHLRYIYNGTPAEKTGVITEEQYRPGGCTPLYDAMGVTINDMRTRVSDDDFAVVTIITDGEENSSVEYTGEMVKTLVDELRQKGWTFSYLGANQDVERVAEDLCIDNYMPFSADEEGMQAMWEKERRGRKGYYRQMAFLSADQRRCASLKRSLKYFNTDED